jgi:hypothetical protein
MTNNIGLQNNQNINNNSNSNLNSNNQINNSSSNMNSIFGNNASFYIPLVQHDNKPELPTDSTDLMGLKTWHLSPAFDRRPLEPF